MHMHVRTSGSCPSSAQGLVTWAPTRTEGGTSVREESEMMLDWAAIQPMSATES